MDWWKHCQTKWLWAAVGRVGHYKSSLFHPLSPGEVDQLGFPLLKLIFHELIVGLFVPKKKRIEIQ